MNFKNGLLIGWLLAWALAYFIYINWAVAAPPAADLTMERVFPITLRTDYSQAEIQAFIDANVRRAYGSE